LKHTNVQTFGTNYTNLPPAAINSFTPTILNIKTTDSNPITSITNIIKLNKLHSSNVTCICPLGNNKIITGSSNGSISLCTCNYLNKKCELLFKKEDIHKKAITSICKLDSDRFITASKDSTIKTWKLSHTNADISLIQTMTSHTQEITKVILLNENKLISCSLDNTIKLWETKYPFENIKNNYEKCTCPSSVIELKGKNTIVISCKDKPNGCLKLLNLFPFKKGPIIDDVYTPCSSGLVELSNGFVAVSTSQPCGISIINMINCVKVARFEDVNFLNEAGSLVLLNNESFAYVWKGKFCQINFDDENKFQIIFKKLFGKEEFNGSSVHLDDNGKCLLIDNDNGKFGINVFEIKYTF
jgi:WD40 repeat protein